MISQGGVQVEQPAGVALFQEAVEEGEHLGLGAAGAEVSGDEERGKLRVWQIRRTVGGHDRES